MKIYLADGEKLHPVPSLREALILEGPRVKGPVAFVGAGGKSTLIRALAEELKTQGKRVIVTTTTHMYRPADGKVILTGAFPENGPFSDGPECALYENLWESRWEKNILFLAAGEADGKLKGLPPEVVDGLSSFADAVLVEADGAGRMPLKAPEEWEPVLSESSGMVVACAGLDSIGKPLESVCFRWEKASSVFGTPGGQPVGPKELAAILTSRMGGRKGAGDREYRIVLNKADQADRRALALETSAYIRKASSGGSIPCIVSSFLGEPGIMED